MGDAEDSVEMRKMKKREIKFIGHLENAKGYGNRIKRCLNSGETTFALTSMWKLQREIRGISKGGQFAVVVERLEELKTSLDKSVNKHGNHIENIKFHAKGGMISDQSEKHEKRETPNLKQRAQEFKQLWTTIATVLPYQYYGVSSELRKLDY